MPLKIIFVFPGQASQYIGMGKNLYDHSPAAHTMMDRIAAMDGLAHIPDLCWNGPDQLLTRTDNVQPAITAVSLMALAALKETFGAALTPIACAGHSLGEYAAHYAAGNLSEEQVMTLVRWRGYYMNTAAHPPNPVGGMLAVLGMPLKQIEAIADQVGRDKIAIANINSRSQIIISGTKAAIAEAAELLTAAKAKRLIPLNVSGAWHSPLMIPARLLMTPIIEKAAEQSMTSPNSIVVANANAMPVTSSNALRDTLTMQITSPIRWEQCIIKALQVAGYTGLPSDMSDDERATEGTFPLFIEVGPGKVISGLLRGIDRRLTIANAEDIAGVEALRQHIQA